MGVGAVGGIAIAVHIVHEQPTGDLPVAYGEATAHLQVDREVHRVHRIDLGRGGGHAALGIDDVLAGKVQCDTGLAGVEIVGGIEVDAALRSERVVAEAVVEDDLAAGFIGSWCQRIRAHPRYEQSQAGGTQLARLLDLLRRRVDGQQVRIGCGGLQEQRRETAAETAADPVGILDVVVVRVDLEARQRRGREREAAGPGLGTFGPQVRVAVGEHHQHRASVGRARVGHFGHHHGVVQLHVLVDRRPVGAAVAGAE